jgi:hypothetical protein
MTGLPLLDPTLRAVSTSFERWTWCRLPRIRPSSKIDGRNRSTVPWYKTSGGCLSSSCRSTSTLCPWLVRISCGIALARKDPFAPEELEFFAWMLPPYRGLGLGRAYVGEILRSLCKELTEQANCKYVTFSVRHPSSGFERDVKETLWLNFFYHYDFRPFDRRRHRPGEDLVLKVRFNYNQQADRLQSRRWSSSDETLERCAKEAT